MNSNKINELRKQLNLTLEEVGKAVGVGKSTVRKWENGTINCMRGDKLKALAEVLQTTPDDLMDWKIDSVQDLPCTNLLQIQPIKIPFIGNIACGEPIFTEVQHDIYITVGSDIQADFCLRAKGDSMTGARIFDGDIVFIREQPMVEDGEIAAVIIGSEATLKRVYYNKQNDELSLYSENPRYPAMRFFGEQLNEIRIIGKAVAFQSSVI